MRYGLYLFVLGLLILFMTAINEAGYGLFSLLLLFPACWLLGKVIGNEKPL